MMLLAQGAEWEDLKAANDMQSLLKVRKSVLALLETARGDKYVCFRLLLAFH